MQQQTAIYFLIKRFQITLKVELSANGLVRVEPYQCKSADLRLWAGIAKTQNLLAQSKLELRKGERPFLILHMLFKQDGWTVYVPAEMKAACQF